MRLEATVPDSRGTAIVELAEELGLSRSQLIDEALALFLKAVVEVRRGNRLVTMDPRSSQTASTRSCSRFQTISRSTQGTSPGRRAAPGSSPRVGWTATTRRGAGPPRSSRATTSFC